MPNPNYLRTTRRLNSTQRRTKLQIAEYKTILEPVPMRANPNIDNTIIIWGGGIKQKLKHKNPIAEQACEPLFYLTSRNINEEHFLSKVQENARETLLAACMPIT